MGGKSSLGTWRLGIESNQHGFSAAETTDLDDMLGTRVSHFLVTSPPHKAHQFVPFLNGNRLQGLLSIHSSPLRVLGTNRDSQPCPESGPNQPSS